MNRMTVAWLSAAGMLLVFVLLGIYVPGWIELGPTPRWILRAALWLLGLAGTVLLFLYLRARAKSLPRAAPDDEVDSALDAAKKRLPARVKIGKAPVLLVIGPAGAAKTTIVQRSGLDAELLAGEVERSQAIVPTTVNVWYASEAIVAEAGGRLLDDETRWGRLLDRLEPDRLAAVFARGRQAPRLAIVCMSCEDLVKPGAAQAAISTAQSLRQRLVEAANRFGIRLPVYVVFTKADRVPYFTDFVRSFTREESAEVLGATLPIQAPTDAGRYKEAQNARLEATFARILHGLSMRRLDVLPRETAEEVRAGVYEFPRELSKLSTIARQFLVELCRPGQIGISPFLRGFYFTGVRPILVSDAPQPVAPQPTPGVGAVDATSVFDPRAMLAAAQQAAQPQGGQRRVPDWTFLSRLFRQIILSDRVAMGITAGGARVNLFRRVLLATAAVAFVLLSAAFVVSWLSNRALVDEARAAAATVQGVDLTGSGMPAVEDLARLDSVRVVTARLRDWDTTAPPLRYRWGLYAGDELLPELRRLYFQRFGTLLWQSTRGNLSTFQVALPDTPVAASQYDTAFSALKAYIITSDHPQYSTREFLTPVLMQHWHGPREIDPERARLATAQFDFFATELPHGNPFDSPPDAQLVTRTRRFLAQFGSTDRLYQSLLNQASQNTPSIAFHERVPGSEQVMRNDVRVPGAFTREGWAFVQENLDNVGQFFQSDAWVLGDQTISPSDQARLEIDLRRRYTDDYIRTWSDFLARTSILSYGGAPDAARKLAVLSDNRSPLLQLFSIASTHTRVDTTEIASAFQPVHAVVPPDLTDRFVGPTNDQYIGGLSELARQMEQVAQARGPEQASAISQVEGTANRVEGTVTQMSLAFATQGPAASVGTSVRTLLEAPVDRLSPLIAAIPAGEVNAQGASFCQTASPILRKYPFTQGSQTYATAEDLNALFRPSGSALASVTGNLQNVIEKIGSEYRARPGAQRPPTQQFLSMLNRMQRISDALYGANPQQPGFQYLVTPQPTEALPEITFSINGRNHTVTPTERGLGRFDWDPSDREARITARQPDGQPVTLVDYTTPWSSFRLFGQGRWETAANGASRVTWTVNTGTVSADLRFPGGVAIFDPSLFSGLSCVSRVVQ